ncbi:two-component sensor histidine kinase [Bacillus methanolicus PB1]|uniref:Heme sensor protein HssS n=1 Tax=Bacillus methanolicus PB1 TaxID=997296 RepID=I3DUX9_BACMT|nr:two-component sensor histidine kinase [Bacillus methanolicus PB1]
MSLFIADFVTSLLYQERITNLVEEILITNGKKFIQTYKSVPSANLIPFMQNFSGLSGNLLQLYNKDGKPLLDEKNGEIQVDPIYIKTVLAGDIARDIDIREPYPPIIGLPFQVDGEPYALFLTVEKNSIEEEIMNSIHIMYIIILFFGSFLILVAARHFVNPILRLTNATKNMAKGKFDFELHTKRKDEIGLLTVSFNEMAKELAKLDRMRQDFVSNVSHEIQSPLTSISGFTKALKQKKMSEESRLHYLTIIEEESERLSRLSENLLLLSYLQQETHPLKISSYRLDEQIRKVVIALEPQWAAKEIEIDLKLDAITIQADEDQLNQVWTNLLSNSIKFTPAHGKIHIKEAVKEDQNVVSITNNGPGISEEEQDDIFKPFYKVDKSRNSTVKGNGLGLSIVKKIVDFHNGNIQVSGRLGEGATFTVQLPK